MNSKYKSALHNLNIAPKSTDMLPSFLFLLTGQLSSSMYPFTSSNQYLLSSYLPQRYSCAVQKKKGKTSYDFACRAFSTTSCKVVVRPSITALVYPRAVRMVTWPRPGQCSYSTLLLATGQRAVMWPTKAGHSPSRSI